MPTDPFVRGLLRTLRLQEKYKCITPKNCVNKHFNTPFLCMYGYETKLAILNDTIRGNARGGIYENIISECLIKRGYTLYYYKPDSEHEIEFLIEKDGEVIPVEVKAGNNPTPSLNSYIEDFSPSYAYKLVGGRNGTIGAKITLPHYFVMFI